MARWLLQILLISSLHLVSLSSQQETRFVYESFSSQEDLYLEASAKVLPSGLLQLTSTLVHQMGQAFYKKPIQFGSSGPLSFSTHFVCALVPKPDKEGGHGIAFLVSSSMDFSHAQDKRFLGAFNATTSGFPVLAIELDTIYNREFNDLKSNHVGIDVNSPISVGAASASYYSDTKGKNESMNLLTGKPVQVWVDYEGSMLNVSIAPLEVKKPSRPLLSQHISLSEIFWNRSKLFVGFSAARESSSAYYVHCFAHQFQLVVVAVAKKHFDIADFFYMISTLLNIVGASCKRQDMFREIQREELEKGIKSGDVKTGTRQNQERSLARPATTRWGTHHKTLLRLEELFSTTIKVLEYIQDEGWEDLQKRQACGLLKYFHTFDCVFYLHLMLLIMKLTANLSLTLQQKDQDILNAMSLVGSTKRELQKLRDDGWDSLMAKVASFCKKHNVEMLIMEEEFVDL
ncbi:hypothetical protein DY000_02018096 [Brassica cretica]|uniref:Legume lectin domain-containing protein n=1 Tax=Brassica cretica TaxID=69181 RepID=A0ABQ7CMH7_BRACR|nr:hypothetical protein DY000_02018096 [Brassica cretica]